MSNRLTDGRPRCREDTAIFAPVRENLRGGRIRIGNIAYTLWLLGIAIAIPQVCSAQLRDTSAVIAQQRDVDFMVIETAIRSHFANQVGFAANDLITQSQTESALDAALVAGWDVPHRARITQRALPDGSFLARELSTPAGRKFMRKVAERPGGYNRLDHLSTIAGGENLVRNLIRKKDGDKFIAYLATTSGGQNMGHMAANTGRGVNLNKPTGRIYTVDELLAELKGTFNRSK